MFEEYCHRLVAGRDMRVIVTAEGETGVGKTSLAFLLALLWDQHGWTAEKATLDPRAYSAKIDVVPEGSVLILDEAEEALNSRRAMKQEIVDVANDFATKRYKQVFGIMTAPSKNWVDKRVSVDMCDYWIQCEETDRGRPRGEGRVYRLRSNEHYESEYTEKVERISWVPVDDHPEFIKLDKKKTERDKGEGTEWIKREEVEDEIQSAIEDEKKDIRNDFLKAAYYYEMDKARKSLRQKDVAKIAKEAWEGTEIDQSYISRIT
jgi:hypothetical protein